jgi:hypothetical protein
LPGCCAVLLSVVCCSVAPHPVALLLHCCIGCVALVARLSCCSAVLVVPLLLPDY